MNNAFIVSITDTTFISTNNTTRCFGIASFAGNTMSRNIINIKCKKLFILTHDTAQVRCILTCTQITNCHRTVALNIFQHTDKPFTSICAINACNAACHSTRAGDNCTLVIAVSNTAVVFAYKATDITAAAFYGIAIAGNTADFATDIFCCYGANTVISFFACEYGRSNVYIFNYRTITKLAKNTAISLQADNRVAIAVKGARKGCSTTADSVIGALACSIHQAAGIYIIFQGIIIA